MNVGLKLSSVNLTSIEVFPTLLSPIRSNLNRISYLLAMLEPVPQQNIVYWKLFSAYEGRIRCVGSDISPNRVTNRPILLRAIICSIDTAVYKLVHICACVLRCPAAYVSRRSQWDRVSEIRPSWWTLLRWVIVSSCSGGVNSWFYQIMYKVTWPNLLRVWGDGSAYNWVFSWLCSVSRLAFAQASFVICNCFVATCSLRAFPNYDHKSHNCWSCTTGY